MTGKRFEKPGIRGWLHEPAQPAQGVMAVFHGASSNCESPFMAAVAESFSDAGYLVLRGDLPFRQERPTGPPRASDARDREGIRRAADELRSMVPGVPVCLAGHSYGGRQTTMLAAEDSSVADVLMLLSYPLHPPGKAAQLRTAHFPSLQIPALFVHGLRDPFGTQQELESALPLIPAKTKLVTIPKAGHSLPPSVAPSLPGWLSAIMGGK